MSDTPNKNELEALYESGAHLDALARATLKKRIGILWKVVIAEVIVLFLYILIFGLLAGGNMIVVSILILLVGTAFAALIAAVLGYTIGLIPFKNRTFNYSDRRYFWFVLFMAIEGVLIVGFIFYSIHWTF